MNLFAFYLGLKCVREKQLDTLEDSVNVFENYLTPRIHHFCISQMKLLAFSLGLNFVRETLLETLENSMKNFDMVSIR